MRMYTLRTTKGCDQASLIALETTRGRLINRGASLVSAATEYFVRSRSCGRVRFYRNY
jgi:hypothetical protein